MSDHIPFFCSTNMGKKSSKKLNKRLMTTTYVRRSTRGNGKENIAVQIENLFKQQIIIASETSLATPPSSPVTSLSLCSKNRVSRTKRLNRRRHFHRKMLSMKHALIARQSQAAKYIQYFRQKQIKKRKQELKKKKQQKIEVIDDRNETESEHDIQVPRSRFNECSFSIDVANILPFIGRRKSVQPTVVPATTCDEEGEKNFNEKKSYKCATKLSVDKTADVSSNLPILISSSKKLITTKINVRKLLVMLYKHLMNAHGRNFPTLMIQQQLKTTKPKTFHCDVCQEIFKNATILRAHKTSSHDQDNLLATQEHHNVSIQVDLIEDDNNSLFDESTKIDTPPEKKNEQSQMQLFMEYTQTNSQITLTEDQAKRSIVLCSSCLEDAQLDDVERFLDMFNLEYSEDVTLSTTHLITCDNYKPYICPLSVKVIKAIAHHCYIVSYRWIQECLQQSRLLTCEPFEMRGDESESWVEHNGMKRSRLYLEKYSLFKDFTFILKCNSCQYIMSRLELENIIRQCGGKIEQKITKQILGKLAVTTVQQNHPPTNHRIVVLCEHSYLIGKQRLYEKLKKLGIQFLAPEWIIESITEYRLKSFVSYEEEP
ncbi:unnamed protein product [Didymodactylos carnosus]|uniref:C2H2-type domain-containing protein n=1 Tax=Didymodactylos carnosus TaxID=1234261 RepID=A0A8S2GZ96_9BILA|nr:unnamed protein product [Didymodactylos carnosus]CAF3571444.1 unnamed protein product [Didymodactylos carnosus]